MSERNVRGPALPRVQPRFLGRAAALPTMVPQLQPPAAPIHMDPVQALGITLHKSSKKIHYVLGGGGKGRLVLGGAREDSKGLGWTPPP